MVTWLHGYMVTWLHGYMVTWLHGYMVTWLHGYMVTWLQNNCSFLHFNNVAMKQWSHFVFQLYPVKNKIARLIEKKVID